MNPSTPSPSLARTAFTCAPPCRQDPIHLNLFRAALQTSIPTSTTTKMENESENAQRVNNFTASKAFGAGEMARLRRLRTESTALGAVEALQGKEFVDGE